MRSYVSRPASPYDRGRDFGTVHADDVRRTVGHYEQVFSVLSGREVVLADHGDEALQAIQAFSSALAEEIAGIADGAGLDVEAVAALNARTEVLGRIGILSKGECSTVVQLRDDGVVTMQTWDWHELMRDDWLVWTIEHEDGTVVSTVTEFGIVGKIGVNNRGLGLHLNILHHDRDGGPIGVPVHVLARAALDLPGGVPDALSMLGAAVTSASTVLTVVAADENGVAAMCGELSPLGPRWILPDDDGILVHTNHFLDPHLAVGDQEPRNAPDSWFRYDVVRRRLRGRGPVTRDDLVGLMASHLNAGGSVCCHAAPGSALDGDWSTLATVSLDVRAGRLHVREGGPCGSVSTGWTVVPG